jgi:DNA modification methylase
MPEVKNGAAQLAIASPPFTNQLDGKTLDKQDYLRFIDRVFRELLRVLKPGGILVTINTDLRDHARYNRGDKRFDGLLWQKHGDLRTVAENLGFLCVDTKIWVKSLNRNLYRYTFAYIQIFRKQRASGVPLWRKGILREFGPDVWLLERGTTRRDKQEVLFRDAIHPEIARRCIEQFTSPGNIVVSPFAGSGTVLAMATMLRRRSVGYETNKKLKWLINQSIDAPEKFVAYANFPNRDTSRNHKGHTNSAIHVSDVEATEVQKSNSDF